MSFWEAFIKTGGMESLGPPVGEARLAQLKIDITKVMQVKSRIPLFILFKVISKVKQYSQIPPNGIKLV